MIAPSLYPELLRQAADLADSSGEPELAAALREVADHLEAVEKAARELIAEFYVCSGRGSWTPGGGAAASRLRSILKGELR